MTWFLMITVWMLMTTCPLLIFVGLQRFGKRRSDQEPG